MDTVEVVSIEDCGYYVGECTSGSTVTVTLFRDGTYAKCEGILIWEEEYCDSDLFEEWVAYADAGEEGYTTWVD